MSAETVLGAMVFEFFTPGIAQVLRLAGCEYILYDMEHAGFSIEQLKVQCAHCRGTGVAPMVRVPRGEYHFLARALDVGAQGVMVPIDDFYFLTPDAIVVEDGSDGRREAVYKNPLFFLPFEEYPWFETASVGQVHNVELEHGCHLRWPDLDVDLELESLLHPAKYPLTYRP